MIRIREVRVIDDEGQQLGVLPTTEALALAQEKGLDLVEVAPAAVPPVCRILDYGQYKYELQKREREAKRKQKSQTFKENRLRVKMEVNAPRTNLLGAGGGEDPRQPGGWSPRSGVGHAGGAWGGGTAAAPRRPQHVHRDGPAR